MREIVTQVRGIFEYERNGFISPLAMAIVVDTIKKRMALKGLNFNCLVITRGDFSSDERDQFLQLLSALEKNKKDYVEGMRFQVVLNTLGHWTALDIRVKNHELEFFLIDAAHSIQHVYAAVIAIHSNCPKARITYSGGSLQADTINCAFFAIDHALAMSKLPRLHEDLAQNIYQNSPDTNGTYKSLKLGFCDVHLRSDELSEQAFKKIKYVDIFDFPLHFGGLLKNIQFYSKYEANILPKNYFRVNGRSLKEYIDKHTGRDAHGPRNFALIDKRAKIKGQALHYLNDDDRNSFSLGKLFARSQTLPYGFNKPDLGLDVLMDAVEGMKAYGKEISRKDGSKGQMVKTLAKELLRDIDQF